MEKKKALGKGLKALMGEPEDFVRQEPSSWQHIMLDDIHPNPHQPRMDFDEERLDELVASIKANGLLQPIIVRRAGAVFQIIAGERRWRAAQKADIMSIPAVIKDATDGEMLTLALIENLQRQDLNPIEEANAYKALIDQHGFTQEELAEHVGKDRSTITNTLRLLGLEEAIQAHVSRGTLSMGHARALLSVEDASVRLELCERIIAEGLSVRHVEKLAKSPKKKRKASPSQPDPNIRKVEEELQRALGAKVRIRSSGKRGKVEIEFYSPDDLNALVARLLEGRL